MNINIKVIDDIISIGLLSEYNQFLLQEEIYSLLKQRLAHICQQIQRIIVINKNLVKVNHGTTKLIEFQKNLKYFRWVDEFKEYNYWELFEDPYTEIFNVLKKHANTLKHFDISLQFDYPINFYDIYNDCNYTFLQYTILELHNLKILEINSPIFLNNDDFNKKLEMVAYQVYYEEGRELEFGDYLSNVLIREASTNLRDIRIPYDINGSCSSLLRDLLSIGTTFVVVDCGGGTLDLTTRKLVGNNQLQLKYLDVVYGSIRDNREFNYELDIGNIAPSLLQYVSESGREWMEEWSEVLVKTNICKKELNILVIRVISISDQPISGIAHEVVIYGLSMKSNYCIKSQGQLSLNNYLEHSFDIFVKVNCLLEISKAV
ncbi:hypothetical protein GLOIN_2v1879028 [Rhizophagus irregularis DAOM 181602=DAOM 197198]|nr:hypothetical protein GLOIN_2v1879028 [Rhizophagus irregularis DAOM 181602=DAOM 197198]